jgi:hypothetical protein
MGQVVGGRQNDETGSEVLLSYGASNKIDNE